MKRLQFPANYYSQLLSRVGELNSKVREDIEKDVDRFYCNSQNEFQYLSSLQKWVMWIRTFPEHSYFGSSGQGEMGLRRVLQAFAVHNTEVGYCQSLNFVAGMMVSVSF